MPLVGLGYTFRFSPKSTSPAVILLDDKVVKNCHPLQAELFWTIESQSALTLHLYVVPGSNDAIASMLVFIVSTVRVIQAADVSIYTNL